MENKNGGFQADLPLAPNLPTHEQANIDVPVAPPAYFPPDQINQQNVQNTIKPFNASLSNEDALNHLLDHVSKSCCLGKGAAKAMEIKNIEYSFIHVYTLETFAEKRQTCWEYKPFRGGHIDSANFGPIPDVWAIQPSPEPTPFKDGKYTVTMPHSEYIQSCHTCNSTGRRRCPHCNGMGSTSCISCNNRGHNEGASCTMCNGRGRKSCFSCNSSGFTECLTCMGSGKLKYYQKLKIVWTNHISEWASSTEIPADKLKLATGDTIFKDQAPRVYPILYGPLQQLQEVSQNLINDHARNYLATERPLIQQQMVRVIQVALVHYELKGKPASFWIFGKEPRVHAPSYPKGCCMCTLM